MSEIARVDCWYDVGYNLDGREIPPIGHHLRDPDIILTGPFVPAKDKEFSELRLEIPYTEAMKISYLRLFYILNDKEVPLYAYLVDTYLQSDSEMSPISVLRFTIDLWRSFADKLSFGSGTVMMKPSDDSDFWQNFEYRFRKADSITDMIGPTFTDADGNPIWWIILAHQVHTGENPTYTSVAFRTYPVFRSEGGYCWIKDTISAGYAACINLHDTIHALFDELLIITPEEITGVWISPFCPIHGMTMSTHEGYPAFTNSDTEHWTVVTAYITRNASFSTQARTNALYLQSHDFAFESVTAKEGDELVLLDFNRQPIGQVPFGMTASSGKWRLRLSATECVLEIRLDGDRSAPEGLLFDIPLPVLDLNSNAWSTYCYSGQRDRDYNNRLLGTVSGAITGGLTQGAMGSIIHGVTSQAHYGANGVLTSTTGFNAAKGVKGFGIPAAASVAGGVLDLAVFNPIRQANEDMAHAHQPAGMIHSGLAADLIIFGRGSIGLARVRYDDRSLAVIEQQKEIVGVKFGHPVEDCTELIMTGGPMQIEDLIVHGPVPVQVKEWVQRKFAAGVRIVSRG